MGSCWKQKAIDYAWDQVGEICGKSSEYAKEMDAINYYNYPKNGVANSCVLFVDNCLLHSCTDPSYDEDPEGAKWTALAAMYEPQGKGMNAGAGCVQKVGYFKKNGAFYKKSQDFVCGDQIFFASKDYASAENPEGLYHTGLIVDWSDKFTVIEGNTGGGYVCDRYYSFDDPRIYGVGRPNWDGWYPEEGEGTNVQDPVVEPEPEPTPEPVSDSYERKIVRVDSWLNVRIAPDVDSKKLGELYNGAGVCVFETSNGWSRIGDNLWVSSNFLK